MILHLVFFKFDDPYQWGDAEVIAAEVATRQHPLYIKEILGWACGRNITLRKKAMDFVVMGLFASPEALSGYLIHPDHQRGVQKWQKIASWNVVDMDISNDTTKFFGLLNTWADFGMSQLEEMNVS
ncbi:Dabb family protein [Caballeronia sp. LjRoot31]|jgi:hypothetical protein|uniref:Dabb family protein n=1 Tax=Caballeronia sp. LjRoot31 TaxID=3342324 RepID=UPI003ED1424A